MTDKVTDYYYYYCYYKVIAWIASSKSSDQKKEESKILGLSRGFITFSEMSLEYAYSQAYV
jgi:hypothetical protein